MKICHITTVHSRFDTRIFYKECKSLTNLYDVSLIVSDGLGNEVVDKVSIIDVGQKKGNSRIKRFLSNRKKVFVNAKQLNAEIYHFHDPELLFVGSKLKKLGKKVIFDIHEDVPRQILRKHWIPSLLRKTISNSYAYIEKIKSKKFDLLITVTPTILKKLGFHPFVIEIRNYPLLFKYQTNDKVVEKENIIYVGKITIDRGIFQMLDALAKFPGLRMTLVGKFMSDSLKEKVKTHHAWKQIDYKGWLNQKEIFELLAQSYLGLVVLQPTGDYEDAFPVKLFEYMQAGIPVISSKFPLWKEIVDENNCGVCVNPQNPDEISNAIYYLISNRSEACEMGKKGYHAVLTKYNWATEEKKLFAAYEKLLKN